MTELGGNITWIPPADDRLVTFGMKPVHERTYVLTALGLSNGGRFFGSYGHGVASKFVRVLWLSGCSLGQTPVLPYTACRSFRPNRAAGTLPRPRPKEEHSIAQEVFSHSTPSRSTLGLVIN